MEYAAFADPTVIKTGTDSYQVSYGTDKGLYVEFTDEPKLQEFASESAGRPIYKQVPYIKIMIPGDKTKVIKREVKMKSDSVSPSDLERFPNQWAAFKAQEEQKQ